MFEKDTRRRIQLFSAIIAGATIFSASPQITGNAANAQDRQISVPVQDKYISSSAVRKAQGKYRVKIGQRGSFVIRSMKAPEGYPSKCFIDRASLVKQVRKLGFSAATRTSRSTIAMKATKSGNQTICSGSGNGCLVIISDWDPDDPLLPK